MKKKKIRR